MVVSTLNRIRILNLTLPVLAEFSTGALRLVSRNSVNLSTACISKKSGRCASCTWHEHWIKVGGGEDKLRGIENFFTSKHSWVGKFKFKLKLFHCKGETTRCTAESLSCIYLDVKSLIDDQRITFMNIAPYIGFKFVNHRQDAKYV
jgi:hypothetical protein